MEEDGTHNNTLVARQSGTTTWHNKPSSTICQNLKLKKATLQFFVAEVACDENLNSPTTWRQLDSQLGQLK